MRNENRINDTSLTESVINGMYVILRKLKGYTHFDFLRDDFYVSQYLLLLEKINEEFETSKRELDKTTKKTKTPPMRRYKW